MLAYSALRVSVLGCPTVDFQPNYVSQEENMYMVMYLGQFVVNWNHFGCGLTLMSSFLEGGTNEYTYKYSARPKCGALESSAIFCS